MESACPGCGLVLEPPQPTETVTVADVLRATTGEEHEAAVRRWARDVWAAWAPHAPTVRRWLDAALSGGP